MSEWRVSGSYIPAQPNLPGVFAPPRRLRLSTPHEQALGLAKTRLSAVILMFSLAWFTLGGRLAYLTLGFDAAPTITRSATNTAVTSRADIIDRNGTLLATSLPTVSLCSDSKDIIDVNEAVQKLTGALPDLDPQKLAETLNNGRNCSTIKRHLSPRQYYEVNKLGIAGLQFRPDERRIYPTGNLSSHVVGYSDIDDNGLGGIERGLNTRLSENADPLALSIDLRVQSIMRQELNTAMNDFKAEAAAGLVMNIATGEILSMVSLPDFDPSRAGSATEEQRFNRTTLGVYEMGSTFKIFNTALALDSGTTRIGDVLETINPLTIGRHSIRDFEKEDHNLNITEIFVHSSNIGSARMAQKFGGERQRAFFERLGLTDKLALEVSEVGAPLVPSARDWGETTTLTASYGHGIAVNAVQLIAAVATIVNDGHPVRPTLLKQNSDTVNTDPDTVISPNTSAIMRALMRLVVSRGTAKKADVEGYLVGGKTGTADKLNANRQYSNNDRRSSFIGVFPINAPQYIVFAMLDDPKGNAKTYGFATAGWVVAPSVNRITAQIAPILGLAPYPQDLNEATERRLLKPLANQLVDGVPVSATPNLAQSSVHP